MTMKSVLEIEVNDSAFTRYLGKYRQYQQSLRTGPGVPAVPTPRGSNGQFLPSGGGVAGGRTFTWNLPTGGTFNWNMPPRAMAGLTAPFATSTRSLSSAANTLGQAAQSLLKWSSISTLFAGLLGAGGLFGLDRMAGVAASGRRQALGLGTTYGEQSAFELNYRRLVSPDAVLSGINEALHDASKRVALYTAGVPRDQIAKGDTAEIGAGLIARLKEMVDRTPEAAWQQTILDARRFSQFGLTIEDLKRIKSTPASEVADVGNAFQHDRLTLDLTEKSQRAWQDFNTQLSRAGRQIETVLIAGLTPLTPALEKLSGVAVKMVSDFLKSAQDNHWIDKLAEKLQQFGNYLSSPEFETDIKDFGHTVSRLGGDLAVLADKLESIFKILHISVPVVAAAYAGGRVAGVPGAVVAGGAALAWELLDPQSADPNAPHTSNPNLPPGNAMFTRRDRTTVGPSSIPRDFGAETTSPLAKSMPLPWNVDVIDLIRRLENSGDKAISPAGAVGRMQIMPATAKLYNLDPNRLTDPQYSLSAAKVIVSDFLKKARSLDELLILYNSTPQYLKKFRAAGGDMSVLLPETRKYLEHAHQLLGREMTVTALIDEASLARAFTAAIRANGTPGRPGQLTITLNNQTGANPVVGATQLAQ